MSDLQAELEKNLNEEKVADDVQECVSLSARIEALLFASPKPLSYEKIWEFINDDEITLNMVNSELDRLIGYYTQRKGGFSIVELTDGFQFRTESRLSFLVELVYQRRSRPLSKAAQETLAIIAYRQPVTRADIEFIRGVDAGSIIKNLLEREFICCLGRKDVAGKPMLFGTTPLFLETYGLQSLKSLPPLESFQPNSASLKLAKGEINQKQEEKPVELGIE